MFSSFFKSLKVLSRLLCTSSIAPGGITSFVVIFILLSIVQESLLSHLIGPEAPVSTSHGLWSTPVPYILRSWSAYIFALLVQGPSVPHHIGLKVHLFLTSLVFAAHGCGPHWMPLAPVFTLLVLEFLWLLSHLLVQEPYVFVLELLTLLFSYWSWSSGCCSLTLLVLEFLWSCLTLVVLEFL
jgi:hypothetical protein